MPKKKRTSYITHAECAAISGQIRNEIIIIRKSLVGEDMRGGIVKDVSDMKSDLKTMKEYVDNQKTRGRDWKLLAFAVIGSVGSGIVIALISYLLKVL